MKSWLHRTIALVLTGIVLISTFTFAIDMHYCGNTLVDYSFRQQAANCGMESISITPPCENSDITRQSCCSDEQFVRIGLNEIQKEAQLLLLGVVVLSMLNDQEYVLFHQHISGETLVFSGNSPPEIQRDRQILFQTFLI